VTCNRFINALIAGTQNLQRVKPAVVSKRVTSSSEATGSQTLTSESFKEFVDRRDYTAAITLLTVRQQPFSTRYRTAGVDKRVRNTTDSAVSYLNHAELA